MHTLLAFLLFFLLSASAYCQLDAPSAFDDGVSCRRDGCIWLPLAGHPILKRGKYSYSVDTTEDKETDAAFVLRQGEETLLRTELKDLSASVAVTWSSDSERFAVTWSDGGSIGGFHVRTFKIQGQNVVETPSVARAVAEFRSRHYCQTRGNNIQAYKWGSADSLVVVASVYDTSDCGPDLGHTEAYIVRAEDGAILHHMGLAQFKHYREEHPDH